MKRGAHCPAPSLPFGLEMDHVHEKREKMIVFRDLLVEVGIELVLGRYSACFLLVVVAVQVRG